MPTMSLLFALLTYTLQVALMALLMVGINRPAPSRHLCHEGLVGGRRHR